MFGRGIRLFRLFGFQVSLDWSWFIVVVLIVWSLGGSQGLFRLQYGNRLSQATYWWMGIAGALGLFLSIVIHEFSHAMIARRHGIPMRGITLFIFGGVAEMEREPPTPKAEFWMAIAGPIASVLIALACFGLYGLGVAAGWPLELRAVVYYLGVLNAVLVAFNIIPAFPLDGGRVLRSALWHWKGSLSWATRITSQIGSGFGVVLIVLGVLFVLRGDFIGGMWWFLIGMFLRQAAQASYQQLLIRRALEGEPITRFMNPAPITVPPDVTIRELVDDYIYRYHFKMFPVAENERLIGCVDTRQLKEVPREEWDRRTVGEIVQACSPENTIDARADAMQLLARVNRTGESRLMVVEDGRLLGIVAVKDLMNYLSIKMELEPEVEEQVEADETAGARRDG